MTIALPNNIVEALKKRAEQEGIRPQFLAYRLLQENLGLPVIDYRPRDEWEKRLMTAGTECGVSLSDDALSRENLYED